MKKIGYVLFIILGLWYVVRSIPSIQRSNYPDQNKKLGLFTQNKTTKIIFGGDVMLGRSVRNKINELQNFNYPFENVSGYLATADIVFVNLENPVIDKCPYHASGYTFCSDPESIETLKFGNVDVVSIANNHTGNYGKNGFEATKKFLIEDGLEYTGDNNLVVRDFEDTKIGFLGFDYVFKKPTLYDFELVKKSDSEVDFLIVSPHWGVEYKADPENYQRDWAKTFVENGADLIIGSHPHWVQGVECIKDDNWEYFNRETMAEKLKLSGCDILVFYSLGNFVFDQMWSEETKKGILVETTLNGPKIQEVMLLNTYIEKIGQPIIVE